MKQQPTLIIGMGNILMQDEGIGVRVVEELEARYHIPDTLRVIDGGTTGMELLEPMRRCRRLIVCDAVNTGEPPGSLVRIADEQVPAFFQTKLSNHQLGLSDLLGLLTLTGQRPEQVVIIGMVPYRLENQLGLSLSCEQRLEQMLAMLVAELAAQGVALQARERPRRGHWQQQAAQSCA